MKIPLVLFAAVVLFVAGADAIKCYQCADCAKPENSADCSIVGVSLFDGCQLTVLNGMKTRTCTLMATCDIAQPQCDGNTQDNCVACCNTDNCNSAGIASFNVFTIFMVLLISLFFIKQ